MREFFYRPVEGYLGDVIPYYEDGVFYLFYLYAHRNPEKYGEGTSWYLITTTDFVCFTEYGEVLKHENCECQDLNAFTGSIIKWKETYYLYYTGYNAHPQYCVHQVPQQAVMVARGKDLFNWEKLPQYTFYTSDALYEFSDWRDPFVFWNSKAGKYFMLLAARKNTGPKRRRGCIGLCTSDNLLDWTVEQPFFAPDLYMTHECPEVFQMGEWWYLLYSTFSEKFATHYRVSRSIDGPWAAPEDDTIDSRCFYAGKTASDGEKRYIFGWIPTKKQESDYEDYEWAGNLVIHELRQNSDGTLRVCMPESIDRYFSNRRKVTWYYKMGKYSKGKDEVCLDVPTSFGAVLTEQDLPVCCKISCRMKFSEGTKSLGIMLKSDETMDTSYYIRLEPGRNRMVFDMWPRKQKLPGADTWEIDGHRAFFVESERFYEFMGADECTLSMILCDTMCVVYLNGSKAMTVRMYLIPNGKLGFFVSEGRGKLLDLQIFTAS